jgi:hypothetical protein
VWRHGYSSCTPQEFQIHIQRFMCHTEAKAINCKAPCTTRRYTFRQRDDVPTVFLFADWIGVASGKVA